MSLWALYRLGLITAGQAEQGWDTEPPDEFVRAVERSMRRQNR